MKLSNSQLNKLKSGMKMVLKQPWKFHQMFLVILMMIIQLKYQHVTKFNGVYLRHNLPRIKYGTYIINLGKYESIGTHWRDLYVNGKSIMHFYSFGVQHIAKEIRNKKYS